MLRLKWTDSGPPYSRESREWLASYLIRVTSVMAPLLGAFLIYRWYIGALPFNLAASSVLLLPLASLPWLSKYLELETKSLLLLTVSSLNAASSFAASGLVGLGPLLSTVSALMALVFYGNRVFLALLAAIVLAVVASALGHYHLQGPFRSAVDLANPINVFGKAMTITFVLTVLLFGLRGANRLVSEQRDLAKRKGLDLQRALEELRRFIDSANAPIFGVDRKGRVTEWNAMTADIMGYSKEEALGNHLVDTYITEEHKQEVANVLDSALEGRSKANYELPLYSKSGDRIEVLLNATTRRDFEGSIVGVIGIGQDITGFREQEKRLRVAQKMEAVGHLTGGIAHDFNNLLAVIQGNLNIALDPRTSKEDPSFLQECLGDAAAASSDAAKLIRQLLAFTSQQAFQHERVNLRNLISEAIQKAFPIENDGRAISIDIDQGDLTVMVDSPQLESAIMGLLENAEESLDGSGEISVSVAIRNFNGAPDSEYSLPAGEYIVMTVSDDGCGIEESVLLKVLDPFFTTKETGEGAGLGLSVIHGFAKKSGGLLRMRSELGVGTRAELVLPLIRGRVDESEGRAESEYIEFAQQTGTVLVVEDEERLRKLAARHLRSTGFEVIEAGDVEEALAVLARKGDEVDVLFSDIRMPGDLSGRQLAQEVSSLYPGIRTLLTTGYEEESPEASEEGLSPEWKVPVLRKPYSRADLIGAVIALA